MARVRFFRKVSLILWRSEFLPASVTSSKLVQLSNREAMCKAAAYCIRLRPSGVILYTAIRLARTGLASPPDCVLLHPQDDDQQDKSLTESACDLHVLRGCRDPLLDTVSIEVRQEYDS